MLCKKFYIIFASKCTDNGCVTVQYQINSFTVYIMKMWFSVCPDKTKINCTAQQYLQFTNIKTAVSTDGFALSTEFTF